MKKIFIITGEPSGDRLASKVIQNLNKKKYKIEYLGICGNYLKSLGIKSIFDQKEITFLAFTEILINFFKIKKKINYTVDQIINFNPDILFTVDSPDFSLRVCKKVKTINKNIRTIHFIAPKVWAWRGGRVKKMKKFLDHILLLFNFEKKFFDKERLKNTFVGHPILDKNENENENKTQISEFINNKNIISIFPGSRESEIKIHTPILLNFIKKMNSKYNNYLYIFHSTKKFYEILKNKIKKENIDNIEIISDDIIKLEILRKSKFAIVKSGTVSLEVCKYNIPSIIIYKMNFINYYLAKFLLNIKYVNMINIINNKEIIPELIQSECNSDEIFKSVCYFMKKPDFVKNQLNQVQHTINDLKSSSSSSDQASKVLLSYLT